MCHCPLGYYFLHSSVGAVPNEQVSGDKVNASRLVALPPVSQRVLCQASEAASTMEANRVDLQPSCWSAVLSAPWDDCSLG
jgi:hypothetical protein